MKTTVTVEIEQTSCDACGAGPLYEYITDSYITGAQIDLCIDCYIARQPRDDKPRRGRKAKVL